jgi:hypothetical protein
MFDSDPDCLEGYDESKEPVQQLHDWELVMFRFIDPRVFPPDKTRFTATAEVLKIASFCFRVPFAVFRTWRMAVSEVHDIVHAARSGATLLAMDCERYGIDSTPLLRTADILDAFLSSRKWLVIEDNEVDYWWQAIGQRAYAKFTQEDKRTLDMAGEALTRLSIHLRLAGRLVWIDGHELGPLKTTAEGREVPGAIPGGASRSPHPDGPEPPTSFWYKNAPAQLEPLPWKLLKHVWNAPEQRSEVETAIEAVWGDHASKDAVESAKRKVNKALEKVCVGRFLQIKNGYIVLE